MEICIGSKSHKFTANTDRNNDRTGFYSRLLEEISSMQTQSNETLTKHIVEMSKSQNRNGNPTTSSSDHQGAAVTGDDDSDDDDLIEEDDDEEDNHEVDGGGKYYCPVYFVTHFFFPR